MRDSIKLTISISIAYSCLILLMRLFDTILVMYLFPGLFFSMAIAFVLKTSSTQKVLFVFFSVCIYFLSFYIGMLDAYWGPKTQNLIAGTTIGAFLEIILFSLVYETFNELKMKHIAIAVIIGFFSFFIWGDWMLVIGFAVWYSGMAYVILDNYQRSNE